MKLSIAKIKLLSDIKQIYLFYKFNKELMEQEYTLTTELYSLIVLVLLLCYFPLPKISPNRPMCGIRR